MSGSYPSPAFATLALQTPLALTQGGSGAATASAALTAFGGAALAGSNTQVFSVGFPTAATHAIPLTGAPINVKWYGAVGNGTTDDTAAFVAALATGRNVYMPPTLTGYLITNSLTLAASGQMLFGDSRLTSFFVINTSFNMSATGVIIFNAPVNQGPTLYRIGIQFTQPDTTSYSALTNYPVAIYAQIQPRFTVRECLVSNASMVIDMRGNSGDSYINDLLMSFYKTGIWVDGSLDWVRISKLHAVPVGMTANQMIAARLAAVGVIFVEEGGGRSGVRLRKARAR